MAGKSGKRRRRDTGHFAEMSTIERKRDQALWCRYGIGLHEFTAILRRQNNRCAICKTEDPGRRGWFVDHKHNKGERPSRSVTADGPAHVRGILCPACNARLGAIEAGPGGRALLSYLRRTAPSNDERPLQLALWISMKASNE